jgi:protein-tyrosine kinase
MPRLQKSVLDFFEMESPLGTEFRRLLQRFTVAANEREIKSILLTSAMTSEGKSTVAALLAITAARHKGLRTIIVDSDLRRPTMHKLFCMGRDRGMVDILTQGMSLNDCIKKTSAERLDIITSGSQHEHVAEIFDAEAIARVIDELKFYYDLIVVDTAPVLPVSDPMLLSGKVDGIIMVVKAGVTQREVVLRAADILSANRHKMLGIVLNNMNNTLPFQYNYEYFGYEYQTKEVAGKATKTKPVKPLKPSDAITFVKTTGTRTDSNPNQPKNLSE